MACPVNGGVAATFARSSGMVELTGFCFYIRRARHCPVQRQRDSWFVVPTNKSNGQHGRKTSGSQGNSL